ncbi:ATP synthase subunit 4, mitochondrial [[Emmonsia] crescens]|uniref:ATP synthase subunit 4 n=1 Tax=[Emmonsia] crescens TaxID=73230 RepID=A0A0G2I1A0_9EURO|nr:ATP synthase subunit 4, mitochondrial [Emmonsia crescens UAMH 3008]
MASRLAKSAIGAARVRPVISARTIPAATTSFTSTRSASNVPAEDPKTKAQSIIDALPGNSLVSKTAILSAGAGLSIAAISNELYVFNEETVAAFCLLSVFAGVAKMAGPMYKEWAESQIKKQKDILNGARANHTNAVKERIENVKQLSGVVEITKNLFEVSKETARLEAQAFEMEQRTAIAAEAKKVLDSWVQYEGQVKVRQQRELAQSVISKIQKELENPKVIQQILQQSVADVEKIAISKPSDKNNVLMYTL